MSRLWRLSPLFLLRVAGIPHHTVERMTSTASARWASRALAVEDGLSARRDALVDRLEGAVAAVPDMRHHLVALRRDVHNLRPPRDRTGMRTRLGQLDPATAAEVGWWLDTWDRYADHLARGPAVLADDQATQRTALRALIREPVLRHGILLASPMLDRALDENLAGSVQRPDKRARRAERSLLEYLQRTAAKTSPFSTFTPVCLGRFEPHPGPLVDVVSTSDPVPHSRVDSLVRLNIAVLGRLSGFIMDNASLLADVPLALTVGRRINGDQLRYLRLRRAVDQDTPVDPVHEDLFNLPVGPLLHDVLDQMDGHGMDDDRVMPLRDLAHRMCRLDPTRDIRDVRRHLGHLVRLGVLVAPPLRPDIHHVDPLAGYRSALAGLGVGWADRLAGHLDGIGAAVAAYPAADLAHRRRLLGDIRTAVEKSHAELGASPATIPRTLLYEDTSLHGRRATASGPRWTAELMPDLRALADILPVFDLNLPRRLVTLGFFRARCRPGGRCDDVLGFADDFHKEFYDHYNRRLATRQSGGTGQGLQENWFGLTEVDALDRARTALTERLTTAVRAQPDAPELEIGDELIRELRTGVPVGADEAGSWSLFVQLVDGPPPRLVVNQIYAGHTTMFSRFADCFGGEIGADLRRAMTANQPAGAVFAELKGGHDATNLNLHPAVTPYELVCPGETSTRPASQRIGIDELSIVDDQAAGRLRLRSRRLGVEVIPVYLGFLHPMAFPEIQRVLLNFSPFSAASLNPWDGAPAPEGDAVRHWPRLRRGAVVLSRRAWTATADALPRPRPGHEAGHYLDWERWRRDHGIPRRVFATPSPSPGRSRAKPRYVDFHHLGSLALLDDLVAGTADVTLAEMLPGPDQLWLHDDGGSFVTELVIELTKGARP